MAIQKTQQAALKQIIDSAKAHPHRSEERPVCIALSQDPEGEILVSYSKLKGKEDKFCEINGEKPTSTGYVSMKELEEYQRLTQTKKRKGPPTEERVETIVVELKLTNWVSLMDDLPPNFQIWAPSGAKEEPVKTEPTEPASDPKQAAKKLIEATVGDLKSAIESGTREIRKLK